MSMLPSKKSSPNDWFEKAESVNEATPRWSSNFAHVTASKEMAKTRATSLGAEFAKNVCIQLCGSSYLASPYFDKKATNARAASSHGREATTSN
tara:strand:+ start:5881 stop:6162 length:282 start_codon:yes stop_codon:yes gene_type:complete